MISTKVTRIYKSRLKCPTASFLPAPILRQFHTTPSPRFIEPILTSTTTVLDTIHSTTHLPWSLALPLTALFVRLLIFLPISIYLRKTIQRQYDLSPLLNGWAQRIRVQQMQQKRHLGPAVVERDTAQAIRVKRRELYRRWGCGYWKSFLPISSLFIWLPIMEVIRQKAGAGSGILGLFRGNKQEVAFEAEDVTSILPEAISMQEIPTMQSANLTLVDTGRSVVFDPAFTGEGALWFPDLTAADPLLVLPFMLSASMFVHIYFSTRRSASMPEAKESAWRRRFTNALKVMALAAGPLTLQMPTGMLVYWISSMSLGTLQNIAIDRWMPLKPPVTPCGVKATRITNATK